MPPDAMKDAEDAEERTSPSARVNARVEVKLEDAAAASAPPVATLLPEGALATSVGGGESSQAHEAALRASSTTLPLPLDASASSADAQAADAQAADAQDCTADAGADGDGNGSRVGYAVEYAEGRGGVDPGRGRGGRGRGGRGRGGRGHSEPDATEE